MVSFRVEVRKVLTCSIDRFRFGFGADDAYHKVVSIATVLEAFEMRVEWVSCWQGFPHSFEFGDFLSGRSTVCCFCIHLFSDLAYPMAVVSIARVWSPLLSLLKLVLHGRP